jgi:hypothetical protein
MAKPKTGKTGKTPLYGEPMVTRTFQVAARHLAEIKRLAKAEGLTMSAWVRESCLAQLPKGGK